MKLNYTFLQSNTEVNCGINPVSTLLCYLYSVLIHDATTSFFRGVVWVYPGCALSIAGITGSPPRGEHLRQRQPKRNCALRLGRYWRVWLVPNGARAAASPPMFLP
jgi:hypothetical protein